MEDRVPTEKPLDKINVVVRPVAESSGWARLWRWLLTPRQAADMVEPLDHDPEKVRRERTDDLHEGLRWKRRCRTDEGGLWNMLGLVDCERPTYRQASWRRRGRDRVGLEFALKRCHPGANRK